MSGHVGNVSTNHTRGIALSLFFTGIEPDGFVAEPFDQTERVRHKEDRLASALELAELVEALVREAFVAHCEHFVDKQHIRIDVNRDGKPETHVHA